jgi:hypothetical protein
MTATVKESLKPFLNDFIQASSNVVLIPETEKQEVAVQKISRKIF